MSAVKCDCGTCKRCKARQYWRDHYSVKAKQQAKIKSAKNFPIPQQITIWECSDGSEFSSETDALRHELELFKKG